LALIGLMAYQVSRLPVHSGSQQDEPNNDNKKLK
jgi:hypothetical protein